MKGIDFKRIVKTVETFTKKNSPAILTGIGVGGMIFSVIGAVGATVKAQKLVNEREVTESKELTKKEIVATTWKCYIPTVVSTSLSAACVVCAHKEHGRRQAALATAYQLSQTAFTEYKEQVISTIGENKAQNIQKKVNEQKIADHPIESENGVKAVIFDSKDSICYDCRHDRYFKADREKLRTAENNINYKMLNENYISLNEIYDELDLNHVKEGEALGFSIFDGKFEFEIGTQITPDGRACLTMDFATDPKTNYDRYA